MIEEVLRYWLAMIQHEEALRLQVRAAPPVPADRTVTTDLLNPGRGQSYFKLFCGGGCGAEGFLTGRDTEYELPVLGDCAHFFEYWLRGVYRARRGYQSDHTGSLLIVGFPVLYDVRRCELTTLLRFPLSTLTWQDETGDPWSLPSSRRIRKGVVPHAPASVRLKIEERGPGELPFALGELPLSRALGVQEEEIGEFLERLREKDELEPEAMIRAVIDLISTPKTPQIGEETAALEMIEKLTEAAASRLIQSGLRAWPVAIVYDGGLLWATRALQQEFRTLIHDGAKLDASSAAHAYMTGRRLRWDRRVHLGTLPERRLTETQRDVAERFLGSTLTVAQGPPGTGKTELILCLCAQTVIERVARSGRGDPPRGTAEPLLVVSSTNNRAVDNVTDPLSHDLSEERLPLAIRVGSRAVVERVTIPLLQRTVRWLEASNPSRSRYDESLAQVRQAVESVSKAEMSFLSYRRNQQDLEAKEEELVLHRQALEELLRTPPLSPPDQKAVEHAQRMLRVVQKEFDRQMGDLSSLSRASIRKRFLNIRRQLRGKLSKSLEKLQIQHVVPAPLKTGASVDQWEELCDQLLDSFYELENTLDDLKELSEKITNPQVLRQKLDAVENEVIRLREQVTDPKLILEELEAEVLRREPGLFEAALALREEWAALNKDRLLYAVTATIEVLREVPSLRRLERSRSSHLEDLKELFPIWGCTLLSLANAFPFRSQSISRVVIDEAGQCHPAYALPALYRAERALIIGDVHQLEPVITLREAEETRVLRKLRLAEHTEQLTPYRVHAAAHASAQALASRAAPELLSLRDHFRCQPEIIEISNRLCDYNLQVHTKKASLADCYPLLRYPLLGVRTNGMQQGHLGSWRNDVEIEGVMAFVGELLRAGIAPDQIALLTPYRGQHHALEAALRRAGIPVDDPYEELALQSELFVEEPTRGVAVGTLHRFQGAERDIVILSMVVSQARSLAFTNDRANLINVAVSRARLHLVVFGNPQLLYRGGMTQELIRAIPRERWYCLDRGRFVPIP